MGGIEEDEVHETDDYRIFIDDDGKRKMVSCREPMRVNNTHTHSLTHDNLSPSHSQADTAGLSTIKREYYQSHYIHQSPLHFFI